jgi:hypothetical protein
MTSIQSDKGAALIAVLFFLVIITIMAMGTIFINATQVKVAGSMARWEITLSAADGGTDDAIPLTRWVHYESIIPDRYVEQVLDTALADELTNPDSRYDPDTVENNPDISYEMNGYQVDVDIDAMGLVTLGNGGGQSDEFAWGYSAQGQAQRRGRLVGYQVHARAVPIGASSQNTTKAEVIRIIGVPAR